MTISVVIPAYNEEHTLPTCLQALKSQTTPPLEIIVVDNNSTDRTAEVARSFGAKVVHESVKGITPARQRGFQEAKGDIIARTDADTISPANWLALIEETFTAHPDAVGVTGKTDYYDLPPMRHKLSQVIAKGYIPFLYHLFGHTLMFGYCMAIKRDCVPNIVPAPDKEVHEDFNLSCQLVKYGPIIFNPQIVMRTSGRRIIHNPKSYFLEYGLRIIKTLRYNRRYHNQAKLG